MTNVDNQMKPKGNSKKDLFFCPEAKHLHATFLSMGRTLLDINVF